MVRRTEPDPRIVYGAQCAWWDGIEKVGKRPVRTLVGIRAPLGSLVPTVPCCPVCQGMLYEFPDAKSWWAAIEAHDKKQPGYRAFVEWQKGKHFKDLAAAEAAYEASGDKKHRARPLKGLRP